MGSFNECIYQVWDRSETQFVQWCAASLKVWTVGKRKRGQTNYSGTPDTREVLVKSNQSLENRVGGPKHHKGEYWMIETFAAESYLTNIIN